MALPHSSIACVSFLLYFSPSYFLHSSVTLDCMIHKGRDLSFFLSVGSPVSKTVSEISVNIQSLFSGSVDENLSLFPKCLLVCLNTRYLHRHHSGQDRSHNAAFSCRAYRQFWSQGVRFHFESDSESLSNTVHVIWNLLGLGLFNLRILHTLALLHETSLMT